MHMREMCVIDKRQTVRTCAVSDCWATWRGRSLDPGKDDSLICEYGNIMVSHFLHSNVDVPPAASE